MKNIVKFEKFILNEDSGAATTSPSIGSGGGTSYANLGNTGGMGPVVAPQVGSGSNGAVSTSISDSKSGSGDLPAYDTGKSFKIQRYGDKKKSKKKPKVSTKKPVKIGSKEKITGKTIDEKSTMYVTKFTDWVNVGEKKIHKEKVELGL